MRGFTIGLALGIALTLAGVTLGVAVAQHVHTHSQGETPVNWLLGLKPEARMPAIQRQLRGFETTMAEVGYRYNEMYWGGVGGNWDYAAHMAGKIEQALRLGLERSPARRANAENLFLKGPLPQIVDAIKKRDVALFKERIEALRAACTSCHAAENHAFIRVTVPTVKLNPVE
jgi:hypothetical protein